MQTWAVGLVLELLTLLACAAPSPTLPEQYCVSGYQDGVNAYLGGNADEVVEQVVRFDLVVLRESSNSERFRAARRAGHNCGQGEELLAFDQVRQLIAETPPSGPTPTSDECTIDMPYRSEEEALAMYPYFALAGLPYSSVGTVGPGWQLRRDGTKMETPLRGHISSLAPCETLNAVAQALLDRRDQMQ